MADQIRRVGLLKAVGGTPGLVAAVLLAEYVVVALLAAAAGLAIGWLTAPSLTEASAGLLGSAGARTLTPVHRRPRDGCRARGGGRSDARPRRPRSPHEHRPRAGRRGPPTAANRLADRDLGATARSAAARTAGGRPAPAPHVLATVSILITVSGTRRRAGRPRRHRRRLQQRSGRPAEPGAAGDHDHARRLAAVNAIFITWATALDARHSSALARALGATPQQVSAGLSAAQVLPALAGAILGIPGGLALLAAVDPDGTTMPPLWQLLAVVPGTVLVIASSPPYRHASAPAALSPRSSDRNSPEPP